MCVDINDHRHLRDHNRSYPSVFERVRTECKVFLRVHEKAFSAKAHCYFARFKGVPMEIRSYRHHDTVFAIHERAVETCTTAIPQLPPSICQIRS